MGASNNSTTGFLNDQLSKKTSIFGLRLWVVIGIGVGAFIVLILFFLSLWLTSRRKSKRLPEKVQAALIPMISKEIQEVKVDALGDSNPGRKDSGDRDMEKGVVHLGYGPLSKPTSETDRGSSEGELGSNGKPSDRQSLLQQDGAVVVDGSRYRQRRPSLIEEGHEIGLAVDSDQNQRIVSPAYRGLGSSDKASNASGETGRSSESPAPSVPEVSHLGWGHWYILRDLEIATNCFSDANVIGEGGYGIVYRGVLPNGTHIAVKKFAKQ